MENNRQQVTQGSQVAREANQSLALIIQAVQDLNKEAREESLAAEEVSASVQNITASIEEQTTVAKEVSNLSSELDQIVVKLE